MEVVLKEVEEGRRAWPPGEPVEVIPQELVVGRARVHQPWGRGEEGSHGHAGHGDDDDDELLATVGDDGGGVADGDAHRVLGLLQDQGIRLVVPGERVKTRMMMWMRMRMRMQIGMLPTDRMRNCRLR